MSKFSTKPHPKRRGYFFNKTIVRVIDTADKCGYSYLIERATGTNSKGLKMTDTTTKVSSIVGQTLYAVYLRTAYGGVNSVDNIETAFVSREEAEKYIDSAPATEAAYGTCHRDVEALETPASLQTLADVGAEFSKDRIWVGNDCVAANASEVREFCDRNGSHKCRELNDKERQYIRAMLMVAGN